MQAFAQQMTSTHRLNVEERPSSLACLALRLVTQKDNVPRDSHTETAAAVMRMRLAMALDAASRERSLAQAVLVQSRLLHHETSLAAFVLQQNYHQLRNGEDPRFTAYLPL